MAVRRAGAAVDEDEPMAHESTPATSSGSTSNKRQHRNAITDIRYDYYSRPILSKETLQSKKDDEITNAELDQGWEMANPVDQTTGLCYNSSVYESTNSGSNAAGSGSSLNSNKTASNDSPADQEGSDWADLVPALLRYGCKSGMNLPTLPSSRRKGSINNNNSEEEDDSSWDYPLLLTEKSYNIPPLRQQLLEVLFEDLQVPSTFLAKDAVLMCYAVGRTQGNVVDMGYSGTTVTPVYEGYVEPHGIQRSPIGLHDIDKRTIAHMNQMYKNRKKQAGIKGIIPLYQVRQPQWKRPQPFHDAACLYEAHECRLQGAALAIDTTASGGAVTSAATPASFQAPNKSYRLPDGTELSLTSQFRFESSNLLFGKPQVVVSTDPDAPPPPLTATQETREDWFKANREEWDALMQHQLQILQDSENDGNASLASKVLNSTNDETKTDFSDAAAVGIAKRRTKRQKNASSSASATTSTLAHPSSSSYSFNNAQLNGACHKYFSTFAEQAMTSAPISQMICQAAYKCDRDQQPMLLSNIILGGGGSCIGPTEQAVPDTMIREQVEALIHTHTPNWRCKVLTPSSFQERSVLPWIGGSILASLGSFHEMWITNADYEEWGSAIVNRKCP